MIFNSVKIMEMKFIIPPNLFGITRPSISIEIPCCELKKLKSKYFCKEFQKFTKDG